MNTDRIDAYLDDMLDRLEGSPADRRRMLNEAEAHLRDSATALEHQGMDAESAQSAAIGAFGDGPMIVKAANRRSPASLLAAFVRSVAQLAVYGFVAIGAAALLARGLALLTSTQWVYGAPAGYSFTATQCAHWLAVQPDASTCQAAAAMENSDDSSMFLVAAAVIGLIVAGVVLGVMRLARRRAQAVAPRLPRNVVTAIGATAFLGAGAALVAAGASHGIAGGVWGEGVLYTDGSVALIFGFFFLVRFLLTVRTASPALTS